MLSQTDKYLIEHYPKYANYWNGFMAYPESVSPSLPWNCPCEIYYFVNYLSGLEDGGIPFFSKLIP